jgi:hypothetical protein
MPYQQRQNNPLGYRQTYRCRFIEKPETGVKPCRFAFPIYKKNSMTLSNTFKTWRVVYRNKEDEREYDATAL